jgi:hypothetical protein
MDQIVFLTIWNAPGKNNLGPMQRHNVAMRSKYGHLPRPRIQRAFVQWFRENRYRFNVSVRLGKISRSGIELNFPNHSKCLSAWLSGSGLEVFVDWQGLSWDRLISMDCMPVPVPGGYRCAWCLEFVSVRPSREALWREHLFEPLMSWVNDQIAPASHLLLFGRAGDATWAELGYAPERRQFAPAHMIALPARISDEIRTKVPEVPVKYQ